MIFLLVAAELQIQQLQATSVVKNSDITIYTRPEFVVQYNFDVLQAHYLDEVLIKHKKDIKNFGFATRSFRTFPGSENTSEVNLIKESAFSDLARLYEYSASELYAIQPSENFDDSFEIEW